MSLKLEILQLPPGEYGDVLQLQLELVAKRARDEIPDTLILTEHKPVFTVGRRTTPQSLPKNQDIPIVNVTRGGDITYHGPGQVVGYWIRKLESENRDLHAHLRLIEQLLIDALSHFEITAGRKENLTGVWVGEKKIASIGVAVRSWVTYHGFALNVEVNPCVYKLFRPCGLSGSVMSDINSMVRASIPKGEVIQVLQEVFLRQSGYSG